ncbi:MAG: Uma2 family endonuclease [Anaerolineae bacterium]|nr:Uma2 family endonuclease [Anaerolineae bacterium]
MADQIVTPTGHTASPVGEDSGPINADDYMEQYAHDGYEWVKGEVIKMVPVSLQHNRIVGYLRDLLNAYLSLNPIGQVADHPFVMRLDATQSRREPDLQVILKDNPGQLTNTAMIGPADICIEVVSPESVARDHGEKFAEYEKAGVKEYWIIDPGRKVCRFNRLNDERVYAAILTDVDDNYQTPLLPDLRLHVPTLWQDNLPDIVAVVKMVQDMLKG